MLVCNAIRRGLLIACCSVLSFVALTAPLSAQAEGCVDVSARNGREYGCYINAREELGRLPSDSALFWYLDAYASRSAAELAKRPRATVVESLGKVWLFTIAPTGLPRGKGKRIAKVGPIPLVAASDYAAVYMEGIFKPGMTSVVHRHAGAEAWYTLEGQMCLETPEGTLVQHAGGRGVMVPAGPPMVLMATGKKIRRSVVLILQDASKPRSTPAPDWVPRGACKDK